MPSPAGGIEMVVHALLLVLAVASEPSDAAKQIPIEVYDGVKVTPEQIQDVKSKALKAFSGEVGRIYVGQLVHPFANKGFRVYFKDEIVGTYVIERVFVLEMPAERRDKDNSAKEPYIVRGNLLNSRVVPDGLHTSVKRLFSLKTAHLHLGLPDELSYRQAMALLQAIESTTYRVREEAPNTYSGLNDPIDVSKINELRLDEETKTVVVMTSERRFRGRRYKFAIRPDGFELLSAGFWVTQTDRAVEGTGELADNRAVQVGRPGCSLVAAAFVAHGQRRL
jgi:hypothetical protein